jgi:hypothetical protein
MMKKSILLLKAAICLLMLFSNKELYSQANVTLSNLTSPTAVNVSLLPGTDNTRNLGSSSKSWKDIYLDGDIYVDGNRFTYLPTSTSTFVGNTVNTTSTGVGNSAFGYHVLMANTSGVQNSGLGAYALESNTTGQDNAAFGYGALNNNTTASYNCAIGSFSLHDNTSGSYNSATGAQALYHNTTGYNNSANGYQSLYANTGGYNNTAIGYHSLTTNTFGSWNTAIGAISLASNEDGTSNTAIGAGSLLNNTDGSENVAIGFDALVNNETGSINTACGTSSLFYNTSGYGNTAVGYSALIFNKTGAYNTALGYHALAGNEAGSYNTSVGYLSGDYNDANNYCSFFGYDANQAVLKDYTNGTAVGNTSRITASNQVRLGNSSVTSIGGYASWSNISDGRFKKEIRENVPGIEFINKLRPVTYHLDVTGIREFLGEETTIGGAKEGFREQSSEEKSLVEKGVKEKEKLLYTGFIAQDVERAANELGFDFSGVDKPQNENSLYGLRYAEFVVPLVKAVQELNEENIRLSEILLEEQSKNTDLEKRIEKLEQLFSSATISGEKLNTQVVALTGAKLEQNIPNPFEQSTTIKYFIPENSGDTKINIYSERGEIIKSIPVTEKGNGQIILNVADLASGAYQYRLVVNGQVVATKQMIRTK